MHAQLDCLLAAELSAISIEGVVILIFNVLLLAAVGLIGFFLRRLIADSDRREEKRDAKIDELDKRVWQSAVTDAEKYASRHEVMRLHGTLIHELRQTREELGEKIEALPCMKPGVSAGCHHE